ncbi:MAG TPA: Maf family protein [Chthoniobacterales bacterium]
MPELDLILASTSPRRSVLLREMGFAFRTFSPDIEETAASHFTPRELTLLNARRKATAVAAFCPESVVIGADTVVYIDDQILGKPTDLDDARRMLRLLSGRSHEVLTSVWVVRFHPAKTRAFTEATTVYFRELSDERVEKYLSLIDPLDKAGAYAAQENAGLLIERIDGSFSNVVGLPVESLKMALDAFQEE